MDRDGKKQQGEIATGGVHVVGVLDWNFGRANAAGRTNTIDIPKCKTKSLSLEAFEKSASFAKKIWTGESVLHGKCHGTDGHCVHTL